MKKWFKPNLSQDQILTSLWLQAGCPRLLTVKIKGIPHTLVNGRLMDDRSSPTPTDQINGILIDKAEPHDDFT